MKIAVACSGLGHVTRGNESWAEDLGRSLADRGESVVLYKGSGEAKQPYERVIPCLKRESPRTAKLLQSLPRRWLWRLGLGSGYDIEQSTFCWGLFQHLRSDRTDVLHVPDPWIALVMDRLERIGMIRARVILSHGTEESPSLLRKVRHLHHLTPWHQEDARQSGADSPDWRVIPNFIDTRRYSPGRSDEVRAKLGIPPDALIVMTAAAIKRQHKRVDYLIEEFARVANRWQGPPLYLLIAGARELDTDSLIELGRERVGERVRFLVSCPREQMPALYRAADLFVLCSLKEMFGIVLLEAMASGLPCLVHQHPVLEWVTGPGGLAIDMKTSGTLSASLEALLQGQEARLAMGQAARAHCIEHFSVERVTDQFLQYYRDVLGCGLGTENLTPAVRTA